MTELYSMDHMDWEYTSPLRNPPLRFLNLPPELRNLVYKYLLEDEHEYELDLTMWKACVPNPSTTAVSRQVREEVMGFYKPALVDFWKKHFWYVELRSGLRNSDVRESVLSALHAVPKTAPIREVQFLARSWSWSGRRAPIPVIVGVAVADDGEAHWSFRAFESPSASTLFLLQDWMARLKDKAALHKIYLVDDAGTCLRVGNCGQVLLGKMHKHDLLFEELIRCLRD